MSEATTAEMLAEQVDRLLQAKCGAREVLIAAERGEWPQAIWSELENIGLPLAAAADSVGGFALSWDELAPVLEAVGYYAPPVPIAETMLAAWLHGLAGVEAPAGPIHLAPRVLRLTPGGRIIGVSPRPAVRSPSDLATAVVESDGAFRVCLLRTPALTDSARTAAIDWASARVESQSAPIDGLAVGEHLPSLAVVRSAQIAGALQRTLDLSVTYANDRAQFGKPIGRFQAVQHLLARLALETASASTAARFGLRRLAANPALAAATAKSRSSRAATLGAALAHQVHGAIGVTEEHLLQHFTRNLWRWRDEAGSEHYWAEWLGRRALEYGENGLWASLLRELG